MKAATPRATPGAWHSAQSRSSTCCCPARRCSPGRCTPSASSPCWSLSAAPGSPRPKPTPRTFVLTCLAAALIDPHLVDYDLTFLVLPGILAALYLPSLRWWIVLLYPLLVVRAQMPLGDASVQLSTVVLLALAVIVSGCQRGHGRAQRRHCSAQSRRRNHTIQHFRNRGSADPDRNTANRQAASALRRHGKRPTMPSAPVERAMTTAPSRPMRPLTRRRSIRRRATTDVRDSIRCIADRICIARRAETSRTKEAVEPGVASERPVACGDRRAVGEPL